MDAIPLPENDLPGLENLINGDLWQQFEKEGKVFPIESVPLNSTYLRLKPDSSCRIFVRGIDHQTAATPPEGFLLHLYPDADRTRTAFAKVETRRHLVPEGGYPPFIDEASSLIGVPFPNDSEIPDLRQIYTPDRFRRALSDLLPEYPKEEWRIQRSLTKLTLLAYKPGRRAVFRIKLKLRRRSGDEKVRVRLHVKVEHPEFAAQTSRILNQLHSVHSTGHHLKIPGYRGHSDSRTLCASEWMDGSSLDFSLEEVPEELELAREIGRALGELHSMKTNLEHHRSPLEEIDSLIAHCASIGAFHPESGPLLSEISRALPGALSQMVTQGSVTAHGDLHLGQILVRNGEPVLVDFDRAGRGYAAIDLGGLTEDLYQNACHDSVSNALFESYHETAVNPVPQSLLLLGQAIFTLRKAIEPLRELRSDWPARLSTSLERVLMLLKEGSPK